MEIRTNYKLKCLRGLQGELLLWEIKFGITVLWRVDMERFKGSGLARENMVPSRDKESERTGRHYGNYQSRLPGLSVF